MRRGFGYQQDESYESEESWQSENRYERQRCFGPASICAPKSSRNQYMAFQGSMSAKSQEDASWPVDRSMQMNGGRGRSNYGMDDRFQYHSNKFNHNFGYGNTPPAFHNNARMAARVEEEEEEEVMYERSSWARGADSGMYRGGYGFNDGFNSSSCGYQAIGWTSKGV